jgi:hypothetical protein
MFVIAEHIRKKGMKIKNSTESLYYIENFEPFKKKLNDYLTLEVAKNKGKIPIYGCGARSTNFVNLLNLKEYFECFIDDQFEKQNKIVPGCKLSIIKNNNFYDNRVIALGVNTENEFKVVNKNNLKNYFSILPPSINLPQFWKEMRN